MQKQVLYVTETGKTVLFAQQLSTNITYTVATLVLYPYSFDTNKTAKDR